MKMNYSYNSQKTSYIIVIISNNNLLLPIEYVFNFFSSIHEINYKIIRFNDLDKEQYDPKRAVIIGYGSKRWSVGKYRYIHIYPSNLFGENYLKKQSLPRLPIKRYSGLPIIYYGKGKLRNFIQYSKNRIETNIDIIASIFFMITRYEEVILDKRDKYDRFLATDSLAYKGNFLSRPIVDEYINLLSSWISSLKVNIKRKKHWQNRKFAACLTHDVDAVRKYNWYPPWRKILSLLIKHRDIRKTLVNIKDYIKAKIGRDPYDTFKYIIDLEERHGFKSSFYFLKEKDVERTQEHFLRNHNFISIIHYIKKRHFETGLHSNLNSYNNFKIIERAKQRLEKILKEGISGCRQHFLRFKVPDTWQIQEKVGFLYDTSLAFADHIGFRCGTCFPFQPFDIIKNRKLDIWELPLIVMDRTLQSPDYQGLSPEEAKQEIIKFINITKNIGGVFTILWHNSSFDEVEGWLGWRKVYEDSLDYLEKHQPYINSAKTIIDRWRTNKS